MKTLKSKVLAGAAAVAASVGLTLATAPGALAATGTSGWASTGSSCSGSAISSQYLAGGKFKYVLSYSSANGGTNCLKLYNYTGQRTYMQVKLESSDYKAMAWDDGNYSQYAGAVRIHGVAGKCINQYVGVSWGGHFYTADRYNVHCG